MLRELTAGDETLTAHERQFLQMMGPVVSNETHQLKHWGKHSFRVSGFVALIASCMGRDLGTRRRYAAAAYLHDYGKMDPVHALLFAEGKGVYTAEESVLAQQHDIVGAQMSVEFLTMHYDDETHREILAAQLTHHQDYNKPMGHKNYKLLYPGADYQPFSKTDIPEIGRLTAVADTFDALTSHRDYKRTWSKRHAALYLMMHAGTRFDPEIVDVFVHQVLKLKFRSERWQVRLFPLAMNFEDLRFSVNRIKKRLPK